MTNIQKIQLGRIVLTSVLFICAEILADRHTLSIVLLLAAYVVAGYSAVFTALRNIAHGQIFDENFLMTIATVGALFLKQWDEAVAVMLFYLVGELFENYAVGKSRNSISDLMDLRPDFAVVEKNGKEEKVDPYNVEVGNIIIVRPGEKVPLDGTILEGNSSLNTSGLTGESLPREVFKGDSISSGCVNLTGLLKIRVESLFENSTVSKVLDLVENAGSKKAKVEKFITKFARYYTPIVVFSAIALALIPTIFFGGEFSDWSYRALLFLVISCPCALVISVPLSFFGGIGAASKNGVLVKGSNYLEVISKLDTIIFDKTGTITTGNFSVTKVTGNSDTLEVAALAESYSNHPISLSILEAYGKTIDKKRVTKVEELTGMGVKAMVDGKIVFAGNSKLMTSLGLDKTDVDNSSTLVHVAVENTYYGCIYISDTLKSDSKDAIKQLKAIGIRKTIMLTGDRDSIASKIADETNIDQSYSQLMPQDKVRITEEIISQSKGKVAFVGDGINDAPVLARADIGIAMGGLGSEAAIEAADVVIMKDSLKKIPTIISITRKTLFIAKENVVFALAIKGIILLLGAFGFASMWMAIFADVGVSVIAILNAMRTLLLGRKKI